MLGERQWSTIYGTKFILCPPGEFTCIIFQTDVFSAMTNISLIKGGFTHFHQDGHGTVDSGHLCIEGYNEVIMLARMDEINKKHALHLLTCSDRRKGKDLNFDALYGLPHNDVSFADVCERNVFNFSSLHPFMDLIREKSRCGRIKLQLSDADITSEYPMLKW